MISTRTARMLAFCLAVALIILNVIRIIYVPLTCDESPSRTDLLLTYGDYVQLNKITANIHILNSILRKASIEAFGNTPFFLRLPNLLAQVLFLVFCYRLLCRLFKDGAWRIVVFTICNLNPFLFEFWGYSRGYGLAIAFMMMSICYLIIYSEEQRPIQVWLSLLGAAAAVWSNFALLNFYVALSGVLIVQGIFWNQLQLFYRRTLPALCCTSMLLFLLVYNPIKKLQAAGELYYGGNRGLIPDTISSLIKESLFISDPDRLIIKLLAYPLMLLIVLSCIYWAIIFRRKTKEIASRQGATLCLLLIIPLLSLVVQHQLLGTRYLIDRTAIFIIVLMLLHITYSLYHLQGRMPYLSRIALLLLLLCESVFNFFQNTTLSRSRMWWFDNYNMEVLNIIAAKPRPASRPLRLRAAWMQTPSMDYYIYTRYDKLFYPLEYIRHAPGPDDTSYDYLYLPKGDTKNLSNGYVVDTSFEGQFFLYRKR